PPIQTCQCEKKPVAMAKLLAHFRSAAILQTARAPEVSASGGSNAPIANAICLLVRRVRPTLRPLRNLILTTMVRFVPVYGIWPANGIDFPPQRRKDAEETQRTT